MAILKLRNSIILLLCILVYQSVFGQGVAPKIDIEVVRKDIITQGDFMFPEKYIMDVEQDKFDVFYLDDFCLVHIAYKNADTHSSEKFSYVVIYSLINGIWTYQNSIPYYYDLKLLNKKERIFFSDNLFCGMNGSCNRLVEICKFDGRNLLSLVKYEGFNEILYFDSLLVFEEKEKVLKAIHDTICNDFMVSNVELNEKGLTSYGLTHRIVVLKNVVSDTLQTIDNQNYKKVNFKPR